MKRSQCPRCADNGRDRSRNNLIHYSDGGAHCFACGYHQYGKFTPEFTKHEKRNTEDKGVLPYDFTRQVPAEGWRWLLKYGLSKSYWETYCGFIPSQNRVVIVYGGEPIRVAQGRALTVGDTKWLTYGDRSSVTETIGNELAGEVVLVEDLVSAHKIGQVSLALPLLGTNISDAVVRKLTTLNKPVVVWLDEDQFPRLAPKLNKLMVFLNQPVRYLWTEKDPKEYTITQIREFLE